MGKDPAFLFYPNDWLGGTMGMTFEQKGAYMELLMMQFNQGQFTEAQAKQVLSICFDVAWATIKQKFLTDGTYYWNRRLREEIEKRQRFTESRRLNGLAEKKPEASAKHMPKHMEDENRNEDIDGIKDRIVKFTEKVSSMNHGLSSDQLKIFIAYWTDHNPGDKKCRWEKEKQFYFASRIATWKRNIGTFSKQPDKDAEAEYIKKITYTGMTADQIIDKKRRDAGLIK